MEVPKFGTIMPNKVISGGYISGGHFSGGHISGGDFSIGNVSGGHFSGGYFSGGYFSIHIFSAEMSTIEIFSNETEPICIARNRSFEEFESSNCIKIHMAYSFQGWIYQWRTF